MSSSTVNKQMSTPPLGVAVYQSRQRRSECAHMHAVYVAAATFKFQVALKFMRGLAVFSVTHQSSG